VAKRDSGCRRGRAAVVDALRRRVRDAAGGAERHARLGPRQGARWPQALHERDRRQGVLLRSQQSWSRDVSTRDPERHSAIRPRGYPRARRCADGL